MMLVRVVMPMMMVMRMSNSSIGRGTFSAGILPRVGMDVPPGRQAQRHRPDCEQHYCGDVSLSKRHGNNTLRTGNIIVVQL